ncbi:MAG: Gfo/Idh/MocA family oxidoreductase [Planctomycetota bacterium]
MKKYRAAVIGCGNIGADVSRYTNLVQPATHAGAFENNPDTDLVALVDINKARLDSAISFFPNARGFLTVHEMMETIRPEIVSVATPSASHASIVLEVAAFRPKAIVCEKPIADRAEDAEEMIRMCKEHDIFLFVNHMRRFDPFIRKAKERVEAWKPVIQARATYYRGLHNNGTHFIDLLRFFLGPAVGVMSLMNDNRTFDDLPGDRNYDGMIIFASGARAVLQSLDERVYSHQDIEFYARGGRVALRKFGFVNEYTTIAPSKSFVGHFELSSETSIQEGGWRSFMKSMPEHVVACLDGCDQPLSRGEDGLAALRLMEAFEESSRQKGKFIVCKES